MTDRPEILCIGAAHWDLIGRSAMPVARGADVPGRIARQPGGVAMNLAMALARLGMRPALLSAMGRDREGDDLVETARRLGVITDYIHRDADLPTDCYVALEDPIGLIAAIAESRLLESAADRVLDPLADGRLGREAAPYPGRIALDGSLPAGLIAQIVTGPLLAKADLRATSVSPAKSDRLRPLLTRPGTTLYLNLDEARALGGATFPSAADAATGLADSGPIRVLVTDGGRSVAEAGPDGVRTVTPPEVAVRRVTGAGDTLMAAHIAAEARGAAPHDALNAALEAAANHISGKKDPA